YAQGKYAKAAEHFTEGLEICRKSGQQRRVASALINLGGVAGEQGDLDTAAGYFEDSLIIARKIGERSAVALALDNLGFVAVLRSQFAKAIQYFEESFSIAEAIGNRHGAAKVLNNLAIAVKGHGNLTAAIELYYEALAVAHEIDALPITMDSLLGLAEILPDRQQAAHFLGLVLGHPAAFESARRSAAAQIEKITSDELLQTVEEGKTLNLKETVEEMLQKRR
ncbi:MAG: tetratricopeptide repeat protein, partial [Anaerolineae bacterium]|nr:tetratricopeptide repeat protein [Anaerolineae bacterium]